MARHTKRSELDELFELGHTELIVGGRLICRPSALEEQTDTEDGNAVDDEKDGE